MDIATIALPFHRYADGSPVFIETPNGFAADFGKKTPAGDRERQRYFNSWLQKLGEQLGSNRIPVFIEWVTGEVTRVDKGCVGHALAAGLIQEVVIGQDRTVTHVILKETNAPDK